MDVRRPIGTRDFGPDEMARRRWLEGTWRDVMGVYGYREVQTPTFEHAELFTTKSGEGVLKQTYEFKDKGDRHVMLRPELTAPVMRFYLSDMTKSPKPIKLYYYGPCFRYEQPQSGRYREFWQFGLELIGPTGPEADAEVIAVAEKAVRATGLGAFTLHVGHIGILKALIGALPVDETTKRETHRRIDKDDPELESFLLDKDVPAGLAVTLARIAELRLDVRPAEDAGTDAAFAKARDILAAHGVDKSHPATGEALARMREVVRLLGAHGVPALTVDFGVVRGLDYYTGTVFELEAPALGAEKQIGGGGMYDLAQVFGGEPVGSGGFGLGFDRVLLALEREGKVPARAAKLDAYLVPIGDAARLEAVRIASSLRAEGLAVDVDLMRRNPTKNMDYANSAGARLVVLLGPKELEQGVVTVKDMATGAQEQVAKAELARRLRA